jgi:hypothetical protein
VRTQVVCVVFVQELDMEKSLKKGESLIKESDSQMNKIYSSRGARRGALIAVVTAVIWMAWAVGYSQGVEDHFPQLPLISVNQ